MIQKDKELLLKDLLGRLPYGVKVLYEEEIYQIFEISIFNETITIWGEKGYPIEVEIQKVKPYLLPGSSMNLSQRIEYSKTLVIFNESHCSQTHETYDWLDKNNYDYRGLIEKGLAIDATNLNIYK